ncbi:hypothetical protein [Chryseobacterium ginsenosidimutans]|uniref:hypothetical protein n=1 Tax=Chryseobacterium ginsenosidimutans TaxID=687846 RepID=UPI0027BA1310|nr:hypothetical protein [Chryseobacterium ginsenosidimutans]
MLNKLKSDYEELEIKPSLGLWDKLDQKLDGTPEIVTKTSFQWWKYAAVVLLLISVGTFIYFNINKNSFNYKKTDHIVKKDLPNTVNPINPEFETQPDISNDERIEENEVKVVVKNQNVNSEKVFVPTNEKEIIQPQIPEFKTPQIAIKQPENIEDNNPNLPIIAEVRKSKPSYINSNELLLGREFDKARENTYKNDVKFGIFNFDKPKIDNVTVLGVTVYIDSK